MKYRSSDDIYAIIDDNGGTYPYNPIKTIENTYSTIRNRQLSFNSYLNYNILKDLLLKLHFRIHGVKTRLKNITMRIHIMVIHFIHLTEAMEVSASKNGTVGRTNTL